MRRALAVVFLLLAVSCGREAKQRLAREQALQHNLEEMRKAIADFRADKQRGPHSLRELVEARYLHSLPKDPITGVADWRETTEQIVVQGGDFVQGAGAAPQVELVDVHSRAPGKDSAGKPYAEY